MAIPFRPPEELINAYLNRPSPGQQASDSINQALQTYAQQKALKEQESLKQKQFGLLQSEEDRKKDEYLRNYNPSSLPGAGGAYNQFSPQNFGQVQDPTLTGDAQMRSMLTQGGGPTTLGPSAAAPSGTAPQSPLIASWNKFKAGQGAGLGQNTALAAPARTPQEQANLEFANQNPMGLKGSEKKLNQDLQQSEVEKNLAQAAMLRNGGPSSNKGTWHQNAFNGNWEWYPTSMPNGAGGGSPAPGTPPPSGGNGGLGAPTVTNPGVTFKDKAKILAEKPKAFASLQNTQREYDNMIKEAEAIKNDSAATYATGILSPLGKIPGTGAKRVSARLETLKAKTLLNVLSSLKNLSSNGASGFGALSEVEGENIRNSISTLDKSQSTEDFKASLDRFIENMRRSKGTLGQAYTQTYGSDEGMGAANPGAALLPSGGAPTQTVTIRDSSGGMHTLPTSSLEAARKRDPGLQVVQ